MNDLNERIKTLEKENEYLKDLLQKRTEFLTDTIHDMSTPLTVANFELCKIKAKCDEEGDKRCDRIEIALDRVMKIIEDYKVERGKFAIAKDHVRTSIDEIRNYIKFTFGKDFLLNECEFEFSGEEVDILIDDDLFYKSVLYPIMKKILKSNLDSKVYMISKRDDDFLNLNFKFNSETIFDREDIYNEILSKMNADFSVLSDREINIRLKSC